MPAFVMQRLTKVENAKPCSSPDRPDELQNVKYQSTFVKSLLAL
jgi:hypothetical protein